MKIKSISEAFSMQPISITVRCEYHEYSNIKEIKLEKLDDSTNVYCGYNFEGKKIFQFLEKSVNVNYFEK